MSALELAATILAQLVWGVQFVTTKYGMETFPPLLFAAMRFTIVAVLLLPFAGWPSQREFKSIAVISVFFGGLAFSFYFSGIHLGPVGFTSVVTQLMTPFTVLCAWPLLGARPSLLVMVGLVVAFAGVGIALVNPGEHVSMTATLLVTAGAASQALGNVFVKQFGPISPIRLLAWMSLFTVPQTALASAVLETGQWDAVQTAGVLAWLALGYAAVLGAIVGFGLWFWLIGRLSLARLAPLALLQAAFAIAAAVIIRHEAVSVHLLLGAAICIFGVILTQVHFGGFKPADTREP